MNNKSSNSTALYKDENDKNRIEYLLKLFKENNDDKDTIDNECTNIKASTYKKTLYEIIGQQK